MHKQQIRREEWDFRACLEDERAACVHYEYAREYVRQRPEITRKLAAESRVKRARKLLLTQLDQPHLRSYMLPVLYSGFPEVPWLQIPLEERQDLIEMCGPQPGDGPDLDLLTDAKWELSCLENFDGMRQRQWAEWQRQGEQWAKTNGLVDGKNVSFAKMLARIPLAALTPKHFYAYSGRTNYAVITLDWSRSNKGLKGAFEQLLKRRPKTFPDSGKPADSSYGGRKIVSSKLHGGRGGAHDKSNRLGALRLLNHYTHPEKVIVFLDELRHTLPYKTAVGIVVAAKKARAVLGQMETEGQFAKILEFE